MKRYKNETAVTIERWQRIGLNRVKERDGWVCVEICYKRISLKTTRAAEYGW